MRQKDIVGIQKGDKAAARLVNPPVARRAATRIGLANEMKTRIAEGLDYLLRIVARAIVDHDDLEILKTLRAHGLDREPEFGGAVVNGNDDAEEWRTHATPLPAEAPIAQRVSVYQRGTAGRPRGMDC